MELQKLCDELLNDTDAPDDVRAKALVLREAVDLFEQVERGPATDQAGHLSFLEEWNKDGDLDLIIATFKAMTPEEFKAHQEQEFNASVAESLKNLKGALQSREKTGRDEYVMIRTALYRSNLPQDTSVLEIAGGVGNLNEDRWLENFPPERREAWRRASSEHVRAILKAHLAGGDRNATNVPGIPEDLLDIDRPYNREWKEELAREEALFEERSRQHEEMFKALDRIRNRFQLSPEDSRLVEEELKKARERQKEKKGG